jgi:hypothetical protein
MKRFPNTLHALLFLAFFVSVMGCSDGRLKTEPVRGIITLDGEPLAEAMIGFSPKMEGQGAIGFARTNEKGEYLLQTMSGNPDAGTLPGEYAVTVAKYKAVPTGRKTTDSEGQIVDEMTNVLIFPEMATYANSETTPFSATVIKGKNRFDFDVKSK